MMRKSKRFNDVSVYVSLVFQMVAQSFNIMLSIFILKVQNYDLRAFKERFERTRKFDEV